MKVATNFPLKEHNTFGMDVTCAHFVQIDSADEIPKMADLFDTPHYILGGGSNTLFTGHFNGTILHPVFGGIEVTSQSTPTSDGTPSSSVLLRVAAGEPWENLTNYCREHNLYGLENLTGIPGLVGSAPVQNIGAYGVEVKDCIEKVEGYYTDTMQPFSLTSDDCCFGYRDSVFKHELKGRCFITHVWFRLSSQPHFTLTYKALAQAMEGREPTLDSVAETVLAIRNSKLPDITQIGCAGSFVKNPVVDQAQHATLLNRFPDLVSYPAGDGRMKLSAGQLIEKAGWKGRREGDAGIYPKQALVIVNYGNAKPEEICNVYRQVIADVKDLFQVTLTPEVNII